jgi:hypothetical protein
MRGRNRRKNQHATPGDPKSVIVAGADSYDQSSSTKSYLLLIPGKVGSDLSFATFPDKIDSLAADEALRRKLM